MMNNRNKLFLFLLIALSACTGKPVAVQPKPEPTPSTQAIAGSLTVLAQFNSPTYWAVDQDRTGAECGGNDSIPNDQSKGYGDVDEGAQVLVKNEAGSLIATGNLGVGKVEPVGRYGGCVFPFSILNVPIAKFYTIEVGDRKGVTYSAQQMKDANWTIGITLGE
jgi:hypothetical protein